MKNPENFAGTSIYLSASIDFILYFRQICPWNTNMRNCQIFLATCQKNMVVYVSEERSSESGHVTAVYRPIMPNSVGSVLIYLVKWDCGNRPIWATQYTVLSKLICIGSWANTIINWKQYGTIQYALLN
jgi:hypothetical protein